MCMIIGGVFDVAFGSDAGRRSNLIRRVGVRHRDMESTRTLTTLMLALIVAGVILAVLIEQVLESSSLHVSYAEPGRHRPVRPAEGAQPSAANPQTVGMEPQVATTTTPPAPESPPEPTLAVGARARVTNTHGVGVVLHSAPSRRARQPAGLLEGTRVTVLALDGPDWARVQSATRQAGWVPTSFLVPTDE